MTAPIGHSAVAAAEPERSAGPHRSPLYRGAAEEPAPEVWVPLDEVLALGVRRSTAYRYLSGGKWVSRSGRWNQKEVLLSSLSAELQASFGAGPGFGYTPTAELPRSVDLELALPEAARRWELLTTRWARLGKKERFGLEGKAIIEEYADRCPAALLEACPSLGQEQHPGSLERVLAKGQRLFSAGQNGALATLGRIGIRHIKRAPVLPEEARRYIEARWLLNRARTKTRVARAYLEERKRHEDWPEVSYATISRVIDALPGPIEYIARRGMREYEAKAAPYIVRDHDELPAGEVYNGDHHECDFFVRDEQTGKLFRPWWTVFMDLGSRVVIGWRLVKKPNSRSICEAFVHAIRPKRRAEYKQVNGLPKKTYVDNGKDYRCHDLEGGATRIKGAGLDDTDVLLIKGLFPQVSVDVQHARPYNAKAKPVERFFGTFAMDFAPSVPGYCGHRPGERPTEFLKADIARHKDFLEGRRDKSPFMTLAEAAERIEKWLLKWYHQKPHEGLSGDGRELTPLEVWNLRARPAELLSDRAIELLLMEKFVRTVQKNGIELDGLWYWSEKLAELYKPDRATRVQCRRDPDDAGRLYIFTLDKNPVFLCEAINAPAIRAGATAEEISQACREKRAFLREQRAALGALRKSAPGDALSIFESLTHGVPDEEDEPVLPDGAIRRVLPGLDRVPLRQEQAPAATPSELLIVPGGETPETELELPSPEPVPERRRLVLWDADLDDVAVAGGGGGER